MKTHLNTETETLFMTLWLFPLVPQVSIFVWSCLNSYFPWLLLFIMIFWFSTFGYIYYCNHYSLVIKDSPIIVSHKQRQFLIDFKQILRVEEIIYEDNSFRDHKYIFYLDDAVNFKNNKLIIQNKEIQNKFEMLFPKLTVIQKYQFGVDNRV